VKTERSEPLRQWQPKRRRTAATELTQLRKLHPKMGANRPALISFFSKNFKKRDIVEFLNLELKTKDVLLQTNQNKITALEEEKNSVTEQFTKELKDLENKTKLEYDTLYHEFMQQKSELSILSEFKTRKVYINTLAMFMKL
jgi:hypothetical protein